MRTQWTAVAVGLALTAAALAVPADAGAAPTRKAPTTSVSFTSQPGDFIGAGRTASYTAPAASITVSGTSTHLTFSVVQGDDDWRAEIASGAGDTLHPGRYLGAERYTFQTGRSPGLAFSGDGRGCNTLSGAFAVNQIGFDGAGRLTLAEITLVQYCGSAKAKLSATLRYNALPLSYKQTSEAGDWIGGGAAATYVNSTSLITASATVGSVTHEMQFRVSGLGDNWTGLFSPPKDGSFVLGRTYRTAGRTPDSTHAGLDVFGDGRGCDAADGTIRVDQLEVSGSTVIALVLVFVQRCTVGAPALTGTLHYFA